jgi:hypothetical protein
MSRDLLLTDKETGDVYSFSNLSTQKWLEGHYSGLDGCVGWLMSESVELFKHRKDQEALAVRRLADRMKEALESAMRKRAKEHEIEFPTLISKKQPKVAR